MNRSIEPDISDIDTESTQTAPEFQPLPNEIPEPHSPAPPEVEPPIESPSNERQYTCLQSAVDVGDHEPGYP